MAEPFTPITKPLEDMTKAELFEIAQERQIPGRHDMTKAALFEAVQEALTAPTTEPAPAPDGTESLSPDAQDALNEEGPPSDEDLDKAITEVFGEGADAETPTNPTNENPSAPPAAPTAEELAAAADARAELERGLLADATERERLEREQEAERQEEAERQRSVAIARQRELDEQRAAARVAAHAAGQLTDEDRLDLMKADPDMLKEIAEDPGAPEFVKEGVRQELTRRERQATLDNAKRLMRSPNKQFKITAGPVGMRYVTKTAYVTTLPLGSILSPLAYDLQHVAQQGFTWEEIKGVEVTEDQLGNQVSQAK